MNKKDTNSKSKKEVIINGNNPWENPENLSTSYSVPEAIVLQIFPESSIGKVIMEGKNADRIFAVTFLHDPFNPESPIKCPLKTFQTNLSLPKEVIIMDNGHKMDLINISQLEHVIVTKKVNGIEEKINIPDRYAVRLLNYFKLDIFHNVNLYKGFDCRAFTSFLANVNYSKHTTEFNFTSSTPIQGDIVALAKEGDLKNYFRHWALCLGNDMYLSKFGETGVGTESLLHVTNLQSILELYDCDLTYVAIPKANAKPWSGYNQ